MSRHPIIIIVLMFLVFLLYSCSVFKSRAKKVGEDVLESGPNTFIIEHVNIIPMTVGGELIKDARVVVRNKKIVSINEPYTGSGRRINGKGKWLMPGLVDMHVHNLADINFSANYPTKGATLFTDNQRFMWLYVANGVTTAFELNARAEHIGQRNQIISGKVVGPRMALAFLIDGGNVSGNVANTPEDGRQTVRIAKAQGYEFIKVYSGLSTETFKAIVDEAFKQDMKVVGHISNAFRGKLEEAFVPNFGLIAHAEELSKHSKDFTDEDARQFALLSKQNGTWLSPTLVTMESIALQTHSLDSLNKLAGLRYVHPLMQSKWLFSNRYNLERDPARIRRINEMIGFHLRLVKAFKQAGVPILAGTDAGASGLVWGYSLHDELSLLVKAGLTPEEALESATRLPAAWLGIEDKIGTVEVGKFADLILLDNNPLEDIENTRKIAGVFVNGRWVSRPQINRSLKELARWNLQRMDEFDWKKRKDIE